MPAADHKVADDIREHGWHVRMVFGDAIFPPFSYTVGLFEAFAHPELIVVGLPGERAHRLLNAAGSLVRAGTTFQVSGMSDLLIPDYACTFRPVPDVLFEYFLGAALEYYDQIRFPCLQLIWPARDHSWPWSADASAGFREQQRVLADSPVPPWPEPENDA
ncbi:MAG: DUF4262 domain-containing protein [Gemmatimonadales bacterium]